MDLIRRVVPPFSAMIQAWNGRYIVRGKDANADCVIGFSFGYRGKVGQTTPGLSNEDLADVAFKNYAALPKIFQFEIADAYAKTGATDADKVIRITEPRKLKYTYLTAHQLDTIEVAEQAKIIMEQHGWKTAILLAQPNHMPRVQAICSREGIGWVSDLDERGAVEFDPRSGQRWTRSLGIWRLYEPGALMYYRLRGWL